MRRTPQRRPGSRAGPLCSLSSCRLGETQRWSLSGRLPAGGLERRGLARRDLRRGLEEVQPVTADHDLVAVAQDAPLDALAVDEDAIEAAVVQHADAVGLADYQRMAARHGRVVEAHVRCE